MKKRSCVFLVMAGYVAVFLASFTNVSFAQIESLDLPNRDGIEYGESTVHAAIKNTAEFDTNIYLESEGEDADLINIVNPSVGFEQKMGDFLLSGDYNFEAYIFSKESEETYYNHRVRSQGDLKWTDYKFTLSNDYRYFSNRSGSEDVARIKRQNDYLKGSVKGEFEQLGFDLGYTFGWEDYIEDAVIFTSSKGELRYRDKERYTNVFSAEGSYRFLPKTSALLKGQLGFTNYKSSKSSDSWHLETLFGFRGDFTENFKANIEGGLRYQNYDDADISSSDDYIGPVVRGGVTLYFTDDDMVNVNLEKSVYESTFKDMNYYDIGLVGLDYTHYFNNEILGKIFGSYQFNTYPNKATVDGKTAKRYDHLFGAGCSLIYDMKKWFSLELKYEWKQRESRFGVYDYTDHLITLATTAGF